MGIGMTALKWYDTELEREIRNETVKRLREAAVIVRDAAKQKVSVGTKAHFEKRYPVYGKMLEPETLKKSISYRINSKELTARMGTDHVYGIFQELGAVSGKRKWKHRKFLRPAFHEKESEIKEILGVGAGLAGGRGLKPTDILL